MLYMCPFFHFLFTHTFSWKCLNHSWKVGINKNNLAVPASHSHGQPGITTPGNWSGIATSSRFVWMVKRCWRCYQCWFSMKILAEAWWLMGTNGTNLKIQLAWASLAASKHVGYDGIMVGCPIINPLNDGDMMGIWSMSGWLDKQWDTRPFFGAWNPVLHLKIACLFLLFF